MNMLHGGNIYHISKEKGVPVDALLDFSANINPFGMPKKVKQSIVDHLSDMIHYPDPHCSALRAALSLTEQVDTEHILCGNGAADLIYRIGYGLRPKKALLLEPTFLEYREALQQIDCKIQSVCLDHTYQVTKNIVEYLTTEMDIFFLCNPNNPTGLLVEVDVLHSILKRAQENSIIVVMDECFLDFVKNGQTYSMKPYLEDYKNMIILKSFTKMYALPGIRLGYLLSSNLSFVDKIQKAGQTWSVNSLAQIAALQAIEEKEFVARTVEYIERESYYLKKQMLECGLKRVFGRANYLFFEAENHKNLYSEMLKYNIIIRKCSNYYGLDEQHFRIAVRSHCDNKTFLCALKIITGNGD